MNTERVSVKELKPKDRLLVEWPADQEKPSWWKLPEILTVKNVELSGKGGFVMICESGGLCLNGIETEFFHRVIEEPTAEPKPKDEQTSLF